MRRDAAGKEVELREYRGAIEDPWCKTFVELYESRPEMDHIQANKILKDEGLFKRMQDMVRGWTDRGREMKSNIFAPTAALKLVKHIADHIPDHSLIMADFDSFLMPKNSLKGINAPLVTNKLKDPTQWDTYETYLLERGAADICYPVDFHFLRHAYQKMTGLPATVYKTSEFVEQFALPSWCTTQNTFNPLRDEYFNTSFIVTERDPSKSP